MKGFTPKRRVFAALLGAKIDKVPVTSIAGCGGTVTVDMQKAIGIYWPDAHKDPEKMAKLAIAGYELTGIENIRVPFDFVIEPEALGCEIKWGTKLESLPTVQEHPYKSPEDLKMPKNLRDAGRIPILLEAIRLIRKEVGDYLPISSLALGPFTLAGELAGIDNFLRWIVKKPDYVREFVNFTSEIVIEYAKAQYQAGSDIVEVAEPSASFDLISIDMFKDFVKPALTKIADNLGGIRVLHICGHTEKLIPNMIETGFDGISVEELVDIARIKPIMKNIRLLGNVSSKETLILESPKDVKAEARKALEAGVNLLEPGCGFSPITPLNNIKAMVEARNEFYAYVKAKNTGKEGYVNSFNI